jgi:hypothetical protein
MNGDRSRRLHEMHMIACMTSAQDAESAVRNYLLFLQDPSQLIDQGEIERVEAEVHAATDPLDRLRGINRLQQLRAGDSDSYRQAFLTHAKGWAEANGIAPASFAELGVDDATLRAAGLAARGGRRNAGRTRQRSGQGQVRVEQVKAAAARQSGEFTLADLAAASGASPMTIRKAVDEMIGAGEVQRLGPTPNWSQPGRAPILFRLKGKRSR